MNPEAQVVFNNIIGKLSKNENLTKDQISFLKARRGYLSPLQKLKYGDILYLNKQYLFGKTKDFIVKITKIIILPIAVGLIVLFIAKHLEW